MPEFDEQNPVTISWRARFLRTITSWYMGFVHTASANLVSARKRLDFFAGMVPKASGVAVRKDSIAGLHAEWLIPDGAPEDRLLLYWHGGGYVVGSCKSHRPFVSHLALEAGVRALLPEYRLAPEHPFPAAIKDAVGVYRSLLEQGYEPANITIAGDSAGGGISVAMLLSLRDAGVPLPGAVVLLSPLLDLSLQGDSMRTRLDRDPWLKPDILRHVARCYCDDAELTDPLVSPVFADASGMPPTLIQVGDDEILLSDSERFAEYMRATGGDVAIEVWPGMWHVWQMFIGLMPESRRAVERLGSFITESIG